MGDNVLFPGAPDFLAYVTATKPVAAAAGEKGGKEGRAAAVLGEEVVSPVFERGVVTGV